MSRNRYTVAKQAPELTNAGGKHSFDYLYESIQYPKAMMKILKMPKFDWVYEHETVSAIATHSKGQQVSNVRSANSTPIGYVKPASIENRITEPSLEAVELFSQVLNIRVQHREEVV